MAHSTATYDQGALDLLAQLQRYLDRTGLTHSDFARRIGYSTQAVNSFMQGRYQGSLDKFCSAAKDFVTLHPIAPAVSVPGKLYETANVCAWREIFNECLDRGRAAVVYGPPGIQKSFPVEHLIAQLNEAELKKGRHARRAYYIYCPANVRPNQLLKLIAEACGSPVTGDNVRILRNLRFDFRGLKVLLVLDEAQHLNIDCLETVRQLLDRMGFGLIFCGSHDLMRTFQRSLELEQWNRRLRHAVALPGMTESDARQIIASELGAIKEKKIAELLAGAHVEDPRRKLNYISAGRLFSSIEEIKEDPRFQRSSVQ